MARPVSMGRARPSSAAASPGAKASRSPAAAAARTSVVSRGGGHSSGANPRPASALGPSEVRATLRKLVGTEAPSTIGLNKSASAAAATTTTATKPPSRATQGRTSGSHHAAYTELVVARNSSHSKGGGGGGGGGGTPSRRVRIPGASRDSSVSAQLAFKMRNAALVYSGVDIMAAAGETRITLDDFPNGRAVVHLEAGGLERRGGGLGASLHYTSPSLSVSSVQLKPPSPP